jgi:hypothetical protein
MCLEAMSLLQPHRSPTVATTAFTLATCPSFSVPLVAVLAEALLLAGGSQGMMMVLRSRCAR